MWFANIVSYSIGCLFIFLLFPFLNKRFSVWFNPTDLFIFVGFAFGIKLKKKKVIDKTSVKELILCVFFQGFDGLRSYSQAFNPF